MSSENSQSNGASSPDLAQAIAPPGRVLSKWIGAALGLLA